MIQWKRDMRKEAVAEGDLSSSLDRGRVTNYEKPLQIVPFLRVLSNPLTQAWLDFVSDNRSGNYAARNI